MQYLDSFVSRTADHMFFAKLKTKDMVNMAAQSMRTLTGLYVPNFQGPIVRTANNFFCVHL